MQLMIVDDSTVVRNKIERAVSGKGIQVIGQACNGREAVDRYTKTPTELVTLDITMPEMDGLQCLSHLIRINPDVRVLVISALADKATGIEALTKGASGFLCKPFSDSELTEALHELAGD
ncbi:MAG: response regulator [Gammaproteobacteria bacterium]